MSALDDLLVAPDQAEILDNEVLPELRANKIRVTDWLIGSVTRAAAYTIAKLRAMVREQIAVLAASGFGDYAFGFVPVPNATAQEQADVLAWAPVLAKNNFNTDQIEATYTLRNITLTNTTPTPYNVGGGRITLQFPSGNRYISNAAYVSAGNDTVLVEFRSEFVVNSLIGRNYSDAPGTSGIQLVTANLTGVTATNPAPTFNPVTQVGDGLGSITPSGSPVTSHTTIATVLTTGVVGVGTWSVVLDGGAPTVGAIGVLANFGGSGITLTPADNGGNPSFLKDTKYFISNPGSDVTQVGRDLEAPPELGTRARGIFPMLAFVRDSAGNALPLSPVATAYKALVLTAFPEVKTCTVLTSTTINNVVNLYVAGQGALLPAAVIPQVQSFLDALGMLTDRPIVAAPATQAITLAAGTIKVKSAQAVSAKTEAQRRVNAYLTGVDPTAPLPYGGLIDRSYVISLIRTTPGVGHVDDALTINGVAADFQLAAATMATYAGDVGSSQTWVTV